MAWKPQGGGGPWGGGSGGDGGGSWGGPPSGGGRPPDIEDMLRRSQDSLKNFLPGGLGSGRVIALVVAAAVALWMLSGIYRVEAGYEGVVMLFGKHIPSDDRGPGLHWFYPAPIGKVLTPNVAAVRRVDVGFRAAGEGVNSLGRPISSSRDVLTESLMLTQDQNIIDVQFTVQWKVKDAGDYLFSIRDQRNTIKLAAESAMREVIGQTSLENALTTDRQLVSDKTRESLQKILDDLKSGVTILQVQLLKVDPPAQVIEAFNDVQSARQDLDRKKNEAQAYANKIIPTAQGQAEKMLQQAEAYKEQVTKEADGEAKRFISVYNTYKVAKEVTRKRLYLETMESILKNSNKVILDQNGAGAVPYLALPELKKKSGGK